LLLMNSNQCHRYYGLRPVATEFKKIEIDNRLIISMYYKIHQRFNILLNIFLKTEIENDPLNDRENYPFNILTIDPLLQY
jgi:hypothetical protein